MVNWNLHRIALYLLVGLSTLVLFEVTLPIVPPISGELFTIKMTWVLGAINLYVLFMLCKMLRN